MIEIFVLYFLFVVLKYYWKKKYFFDFVVYIDLLFIWIFRLLKVVVEFIDGVCLVSLVLVVIFLEVSIRINGKVRFISFLCR